MEKIRKNASGIDIGAKQVFVSVEGCPVLAFDTFTEDFESLASYLHSKGIETVAMEATGVYWTVLYEVLEASGLDVWLVDGRQTKQLPGRKTDVKDCQWIQQLHSHGLLNRCFVPDQSIKELRSYQRLREDHLRSASMHINHMQKALTQMNIRLKEVLSQIHGASGMKMIQAILEGEREPEKLAGYCHGRILRTKREKVLKSLRGRYTQQGLFALRQAYTAYHFYQDRIKECDVQIQQVMESIEADRETPEPRPRKPIRHNRPNVDNLGGHLLRVFGGKDATELPGITDYTWMQLLAEVGSDLSRWPTKKHFTSWLGLAPAQHNSGKSKRNARKKGKPKAGQIFRQIAQSLMASSKLGLGAFARRLRAKKGPAIAIKATARKLASLYWGYFVHGEEYVERGVKHYEEQVLRNKHKALNRLAKELGMQVA